MNYKTFYTGELSRHKTIASKKTYLTKQLKQVRKELADIKEFCKGRYMWECFYLGEPAQQRFDNLQTAEIVIKNLQQVYK